MDVPRKRFVNSKVDEFENLTPLLENEYVKRPANIFQKLNVGYSLNAKTSDSNEGFDVKKSASEKALDLVINLELQKRESTFMDIYYTDRDLRHRKEYYEKFNTHNVISTKKKYSTLNLLFKDDASRYLKRHNELKDYYKKSMKSVGQTTNSLEKLKISAEHNLCKHLKLYNRVFEEKRKPKHVKQKPKMYPIDYRQLGMLYRVQNTNSFYNTEKTEHKHKQYKNKHDRHVSFDSGTMELQNNVTFYKRKEIKMSNTNKRMSANRSSYTAGSRNRHDDMQFNKQKFSAGTSLKLDPTVVNQESDNSVNIQESSVTIQICTSSKFGSYDNMTLTKQCSFTDVKQSSGSYSNRYFMLGDDSSYYDDMDRYTKSMNTHIMNSPYDDGPHKQHYDEYYVQKKYIWEQNSKTKPQRSTDNCELSSILNINSSLFDMNLDKYLKNSLPNLWKSGCISSHTKSRSLMKICRESSILTSREVTKETKTLEVLFPVKSLRKSNADSLETNNIGNEFFDDVPVQSVEVQITKQTIQSVEVISDSTKLSTIENVHGVTEEDSCINRLAISSIINLIKPEDKITSLNNLNNKKVIDVTAVLNSNAFREEVLKIIDHYLKENYLKDDNFNVIVIPKTEMALKDNTDPVNALKEILNEKINQSMSEKETGAKEANTNDLSTFNPRDYKGHDSKYRRNIGDTNTMPRFISGQLTNESSLEYETNLIVDKPRKHPDKHSKIPKRIKKNQSQPNVKFKIEKSIKNNSFNKIIEFEDNAEQTVQQHDTQDEFLTEFNEFKEIFNQVDDKHNSIFNTIVYDPCGLLFKLSNHEVIVKS